jgi:O-6-methylguanine DNA methyltransferase
MEWIDTFHAQTVRMIEWIPTTDEPWRVGMMTTPVGHLWAIYGDAGLVAAEFGERCPASLLGRTLVAGALAPWVQELFVRAFAGQPGCPWRAVALGLTKLEQEFLSTATQIPFGHTCSYATLAQWAGYPGRARAAGRAMRKSPIAYLVPTHRVIRSDGTAAFSQRDWLTQALRQYENIVIAP